MSWTSLFVALMPRSLWKQTLVLLMAAVVVAAVVVYPVAKPRFEQQLGAELDRRGQNMVKTLQTHSDLRLAITLADGAQAAPVLRELTDGDEDIVYVAVLGPNNQPVSHMPATLSDQAFTELMRVHFDPQVQDTTLRRFTQAVVRTGGGGGGDPLGFDALDASKTAKSGESTVLGYVVLGLSDNHAKANVLQQSLAAIGTSALGLYTLMMLFHLRWVAQRLGGMGQFAERVARGELSGRLPDDLRDDLGQLAVALNEMAQHTRNMVTQLGDASSVLYTASEALLTSASRQASNATTQAGSVTEMGATVSELRETFNEATGRAESVIELARRSEESSSGGTSAVQESISGIEHLRDQVFAIAQSISGLVQRTEQIDAIIDVVNDLTEQSNVLAINAGIEAARAGEHGRGFAVVAREVRSLAERSRESTSQVRAILQDIKMSGRDAVHVIEEGSRRSESGVTRAHAAGDAIKRLGDAIAASSAAATQIASSTRQQSEGVDQIWQATQSIDRIAGETASGTKELEAAALNMKSISRGLTEIIGRYRLS